MSSDVDYPYGKLGGYWCAVISVLSIVMSLLILHSYLVLLLVYCGVTAVMTFVLYNLKLRYLLSKKTKSFGNYDKETTKAVQDADRKWRTLLIVGLISAAGLLIISAGFLDPATWFVCLNTIVTSLSLSEVFLYINLSRMSTTVAPPRV